MKKKILIAIAAALLFVPAAVSLADSVRSFTFMEAVRTAQDNDFSLQIKELPKLSSGVQMYQGQLPLRSLQDAAEIQEEYQQLSRKWGAELSAYRTMYDFSFAEQSLDIASRSLLQAESELEMVQKEHDLGVASDLDILQAKMAVTNAKKGYENALMGFNMAERSVQQALRLELGEDRVSIDWPSFSLMKSEDYDPEVVSKEVIQSHESLRTLRYLVRSYENIIERIGRLEAIPSAGDSTSALEAQLQAVQDELAVKEQDPAADPAELLQLRTLAITLTAQIQQIKAAAAQMPSAASLSKAKENLEEYYEAELHNVEIQLVQQIQALELLSYTYAEQFKSLEKQLQLQDQAMQDAIELYNKNRVLLENGMIRPADLEALRLNVDNTHYQKLQLEKDYMVLRKQFQLFLDGYLAV